MLDSGADTDRGPVGLAYSSDGKRFVAASTTSTPIVSDAATGAQVMALSGHTARVLSVAWSSNGAHIASAGEDKDVIIWDAATGKQSIKLSGHNDSIYALAFSPD